MCAATRATSLVATCALLALVLLQKMMQLYIFPTAARIFLPPRGCEYDGSMKGMNYGKRVLLRPCSVGLEEGCAHTAIMRWVPTVARFVSKQFVLAPLPGKHLPKDYFSALSVCLSVSLL